jgi:hypothetical protein
LIASPISKLKELEAIKEEDEHSEAHGMIQREMSYELPEDESESQTHQTLGNRALEEDKQQPDHFGSQVASPYDRPSA